MPVVPATPEAIAAAADAIRRGDLVAFPTETVYGLGADATNSRAVARVFEAKGRPRFNPLIAHVADIAAAERIAYFPAKARKLAEAFWPGPLTLVLRRRPAGKISDFVTVGLETIAVRVPDHPVALALLAAAGVPIAAPSANRSGHVSPTLARHVQADLGDAPAFILDGGPTAHGLESTILDASQDQIVQLRAGAIPAERIEAVLSHPIIRASKTVDAASGEAMIAPGQLASHYAPGAPLRLDATATRPGEALLAFGPAPPPCTGATLNLSPSSDIVEAAANLFAALRTLDNTHPAAIAVMPIPETGLGEAINDRLRRGAAPRN
jgi:L-threonylcarbamoyladenylate synthase